MVSEIDVTSPPKLMKARAELRRLLDIVEFALAKYAQPEQNGKGIFISHNEQDKPDIRAVIDGLPNQFTTTDVIVGLGESGKENRARVKMVLTQEETRGKIRITKPGMGRRATEFEKIQ